MIDRRCQRPVVAACLLLLVVAVTSCDRTVKGARVQRSQAQVWAGLAVPVTPTPLADNLWHDLADGSLVTTDTNGEACIRIRDCALIYVYRDGQFVKSACSREQKGDVMCSLSGTAVYNNECADEVVIQTMGAEIHLQGTWVSVTYLPERQLTLVIVLDGQATVLPVLDPDQWTLGEPVKLAPQQFMLTSPHEIHLITPVASRVAQPLDRLASLAEELGIQRWMDRVRAQAEADDLPVVWPRPEPSGVLIRSEGGALADPRVLEAIAYAVPWAELQAEFFAGQEVPIMLNWPDREVNTRTLEYDPDTARKLLAEAGYEQGFALTMHCFAAEDDDALPGLAASLVKYLEAVGIGAKLMVLGEGSAVLPPPADQPVMTLQRVEQ